MAPLMKLWWAQAYSKIHLSDIPRGGTETLLRGYAKYILPPTHSFFHTHACLFIIPYLHLYCIASIICVFKYMFAYLRVCVHFSLNKLPECFAFSELH